IVGRAEVRRRTDFHGSGLWWQLPADARCFSRHGNQGASGRDRFRGLEELATPRTRCLYVETPTNPTLRLVDLYKAIAFAKKHKLISIIDNTFATPLLQNPLSMGYDIVVHSATKALAGHSDVIAGVAVGNKHWMERIRHMIIYLG